jgi:predicted nucleotidyltransferase
MEVKDIRNGVQRVAPHYSVKRIDLFGSFAEHSNRADSDIDLLVEFIAPSVSLLTLACLRDDLEAVFQRDVDLIHAPLPKDTLIQINKVVPLYESSGRKNFN